MAPHQHLGFFDQLTESFGLEKSRGASWPFHELAQIWRELYTRHVAVFNFSYCACTATESAGALHFWSSQTEQG